MAGQALDAHGGHAGAAPMVEGSRCAWNRLKTAT